MNYDRIIDECISEALEKPENYVDGRIDWERIRGVISWLSAWHTLRDGEFVQEMHIDKYIEENAAMYEYGVDIGLLGVK